MQATQIEVTILESTPILNRIAKKFTNDPYEKEELVQETFIRSLGSLERFINHPKLISWLYIIMKNIYINKYRRNIKLRHVESDLQHIEQFKNTSSNKAESKFIMEDIECALAKLPVSNHKAFMMFIEGYKYYEIASHLDIPEGTVKTRIHMARKLLKASLKR